MLTAVVPVRAEFRDVSWWFGGGVKRSIFVVPLSLSSSFFFLSFFGRARHASSSWTPVNRATAMGSIHVCGIDEVARVDWASRIDWVYICLRVEWVFRSGSDGAARRKRANLPATWRAWSRDDGRKVRPVCRMPLASWCCSSRRCQSSGWVVWRRS
jgi:hypothetical protein